MTVILPTEWRDNPAVAQQVREALIDAKNARTPQREWARPSDLMRAILPDFIVTPALRLIEDAITDCYATPAGRLIVSMPPQEGKSLLATRGASLWQLVHHPETRIGIAAYSQPLATSFGRMVRNWIQQHTDTLDLRLRISPDVASAANWQLKGKQGGIYSVGIGGTLTGFPLDALIIDDPFKDAEQAGSEAYRERVWTWWQSVAGTRLTSGPVVLIMTRWHEDDLAGRLLAAEDGHLWKVINIPALADHDPEKGQTDPLGRQPGEWMISARGRTVADWEARRIQVGTRTFTALYQGHPSPDAGNVWKRQWWRRYQTMLWTVDDKGAYRVECDEMLMSWDMTFKDTKGSDYVVGQVWARRGADVFLLDQVRKRLSFTDTITAFEALVKKWPQATAKLIEDKANGPAVISSLRAKIGGIVAIEPSGSKYARANAVSPFIEAGNVFLPAPEVQLFDPEELMDEAAAFPNGTHDDQVDATSQALDRLFIDGTGATAWAEALLRRASGQTDTPDEEPAALHAELDPLEQARQEAFRQQNR